MRSIVFVMPLLLAASCGGGAPGPTPTPGAKLQAGQWQFEDEVLAMKSEGMSANYLERLRSKADGAIVKRCIRPGEETTLYALTDRISAECQIDRPELRDGIIDATLQCVDGEVTERATLKGSYDATRVDVTAATVASGSSNPLGNIEYSIRRRGLRIGDCPP